jgi:hypothetical protein
LAPVPEALVADCAVALLPDCPVVALPEAPIPAPLEEVPVGYGVVAAPLGLLVLFWFEEP